MIKKTKIIREMIISIIFISICSFSFSAFAATAPTPTPLSYKATDIAQEEKDTAIKKAEEAQKKALQDAKDKHALRLNALETSKKLLNKEIQEFQDAIAKNKDDAAYVANSQKIIEEKKKELSKYEEQKKSLIDTYNKEVAKINQEYKDKVAEAGKVFTDTLEKGVPPPLYKYKSELLPGSAEISYRKYFIDQILPRAIKLLISITAVASVLFIIYGGYRLFFYAAEQEATEKAKQIITYAIVGLLISLFAYFIVSLITSLAKLSS